MSDQKDSPSITPPDEPSGPVDDRFIPVRIEALVDELRADAQLSGVGERSIERFADALRDVIEQEAAAFRRAIEQVYDPFNPDRDTVRPEYPEEARGPEALQHARDHLEYLLDKANFFRLSHVHIEQAIREANTHGIRVRFRWDQVEALDLWIRGLGTTRRKFRTIRAPVRGIERDVEVYRRLVVVAKLKNERTLLLKLFRNIPTADLEALLPHARVSMNWLDRAKVAAGAGGALGSIGTAATKVASAASLGMFNLLYIVGVPFVLLGWRSFSGYRRAISQRDRQRTQNLYYLNLASNAAVMHMLISRTAAEEVKEALLLYCFCALGLCGSAGGEDEIDEKIQRFLLDRFGVRMNFDAPDAFETLDRLGLWTDRPNHAVLPPDEAASKLHAHYASRATWNYHIERVGRRPDRAQPPTAPPAPTGEAMAPRSASA